MVLAPRRLRRTSGTAQASALMNRPPAKVQKAAEQIRELFLFTMLTDPGLQESIARGTGKTSQTKIRWTKFRIPAPLGFRKLRGELPCGDF